LSTHTSTHNASCATTCYNLQKSSTLDGFRSWRPDQAVPQSPSYDPQFAYCGYASASVRTGYQTKLRHCGARQHPVTEAPLAGAFYTSSTKQYITYSQCASIDCTHFMSPNLQCTRPETQASKLTPPKLCNRAPRSRGRNKSTANWPKEIGALYAADMWPGHVVPRCKQPVITIETSNQRPNKTK
jgi:hypothetical protein